MNHPTLYLRPVGFDAQACAALEQQRRDIEAVLAEIDQLEAQCHAALAEAGAQAVAVP